MKKETRLLLIMLAGLMVGNIIGFGCKSTGYFEWLGYNIMFGTTSPLAIDLSAISFILGVQIYISVAGVIGCVIAVVLYKLYEYKYGL